MQIAKKENFGYLHFILFCLKSIVSTINAIAADMKNMEMLSQSGDLPKMPL